MYPFTPLVLCSSRWTRLIKTELVRLKCTGHLTRWFSMTGLWSTARLWWYTGHHILEFFEFLWLYCVFKLIVKLHFHNVCEKAMDSSTPVVKLAFYKSCYWPLGKNICLCEKEFHATFNYACSNCCIKGKTQYESSLTRSRCHWKMVFQFPGYSRFFWQSLNHESLSQKHSPLLLGGPDHSRMVNIIISRRGWNWVDLFCSEKKIKRNVLADESGMERNVPRVAYLYTFRVQCALFGGHCTQSFVKF